MTAADAAAAWRRSLRADAARLRAAAEQTVALAELLADRPGLRLLAAAGPAPRLGAGAGPQARRPVAVEAWLAADGPAGPGVRPDAHAAFWAAAAAARAAGYEVYRYEVGFRLLPAGDATQVAAGDAATARLAVALPPGD